MTAAAETRARSSNMVVAFARLEARFDSHETEDGRRFGELRDSVDEVKDSVGEVRDDVKKLAGRVEEIGGSVANIEGRLTVLTLPPPAPPPPKSPGDWHIGPLAWAALSTIAAAAIGMIGWLAVQVYDLQPARIRALSAPVSVQLAPPSAHP